MADRSKGRWQIFLARLYFGFVWFLRLFLTVPDHAWHGLRGTYKLLALVLPRNETRQFTVFIYEDELENIRQWVYKKQDIETGGDLFGLWIDKHTAVIQLVIGPGQGCRRTPISFYQDLEYLEQCGTAMTKGHGLCNIGQWHSHHRLGLPEPSTGDEDTVWGNMPELGLNRFIVFIAAIVGSGEVEINPFLFEIDDDGKRLPVRAGKISRTEATHSPLRANGCLLHVLETGAESMNCTTGIATNGATRYRITCERRCYDGRIEC